MDRPDNRAKETIVFDVCLSFDDFETKPNFVLQIKLFDNEMSYFNS